MSGIMLDAGNSTYASVDGVLFTKDRKELVAFPEGYPSETYVVPEGTKSIGIAFKNCQSEN